MFPPVVLQHNYWIGDTVLLEPIARTLATYMDDVYVASNFPQIYANHPSVTGIPLDDTIPEGARVIDMNDAVRSITNDGVEIELIPDKFSRIYAAAGLSLERDGTCPQLYLSEQEQVDAEAWISQYHGLRVCVVLESNIETKNWPYMQQLIERLCTKYQVFVLAKQSHESMFDGIPVIGMYDLGLREIIKRLSVMDCVVGPDTGPMHIAGALGVPCVTVCYEPWTDLYQFYDACQVIVAPAVDWGIKTISVGKVRKAVKRVIRGNMPLKRKPVFGISMLEGLGGTVAVSDHVKKIYDRTGERTHIVIRQHATLFDGNPYVKDIDEVGYLKLEQCDRAYKDLFQNYAAIRLGLAKWIDGNLAWTYKHKLPKALTKIWDGYPIGLNDLEPLGLNHVQHENLCLGLPYDSIESKIYEFGDRPDGLPDRYIAVSNGVDTWHKGLKQTKCWPHEHWVKFVSMADIPVVQVGTDYDEAIEGTIDLRGQTSLAQLFRVLRDATAILCTEGGLMHLGFAVGNRNLMVMRGPTRGNIFSYPTMHRLDSPVCDYCYWDKLEWYEQCPKNAKGVCMKLITPEYVTNYIRSEFGESMAKSSEIPNG